MTLAEYEKFHALICDQARNLSLKKNHDYSAPERQGTDQFAVFKNFQLVERMGITGVEQGFLVRLSDKFQRLSNLLNPDHTAAVLDESVDDTIKDIINYVILLAAYRRTKYSIEEPAYPLGTLQNKIRV
jgi:hypothetical protein